MKKERSFKTPTTGIEKIKTEELNKAMKKKSHEIFEKGQQK